MDRRHHRHRTYGHHAFRQRATAGYRCCEKRNRTALEQRPSRRTDQSPQNSETSYVWQSGARTDESQNDAAESHKLRKNLIEAKATIVINNPRVNAGQHSPRIALIEAIHQFQASAEIDGAILAGKGSTVCCWLRHQGARWLSEPQLPAVIEAIERYLKPIVTAIRGLALGGGFRACFGLRRPIGIPRCSGRPSRNHFGDDSGGRRNHATCASDICGQGTRSNHIRTAA